MLILPLPARPDWRRPPWVTLALIVLCCALFFGRQLTDEAPTARAFEFYAEENLREIELPLYLAHQEARNPALAREVRRQIDDSQDWVHVLVRLQADRDFQARLQQGELIKSSDPGYLKWRKARSEFDALWRKLFTARNALVPGDVQASTWLAHMFLHGSVDHLLGNMVILFMVGYTVEALLGWWRYLAAYLLLGMAAAVPDLWWPDYRYALSLGASGAISGVMALFVVLHGWRKIRFFYWVIAYFNTVRAPALIVLPYWLGKELVQQWIDGGAQVNYRAHAAGLLAGAILAGSWLLWQRYRGAVATPLQENDASAAWQEQVQQAEKLLRNMQFVEACSSYARLCGERPHDMELAQSYLRAALLQPQPERVQQAALNAVQQGLRDLPRQARLTAQAWQALRERKLSLPRLQKNDGMRLLAAWIEAAQWGAAEDLAKLLLAHAGASEVLPTQLFRMVNAMRQDGEVMRAQRWQSVLLTRYPESREAQLLLGQG